MINLLLEDYQRLGAADDASDLPRLEKAVLLVTRTALAAGEEVESLVLGSNAWTGWLRRQSSVERTSLERNGGTKKAAGLALSGEWSGPDAQSKHLRQDGRGGWLVYHYREFESEADAERARAQADGTGEVNACLRERVAVLAEDQPGNLAYFIYWGGKDGDIRRLFARFAGFEQCEQDEEQRS